MNIMLNLKKLLVSFALAPLTIGMLPSNLHAACAKITPTRPGEIYLFRGLANIFSLGLDEMGKEYSAYGIENCVFNHAHWESVTNDILERSYKGTLSGPIIIVGHSLGAGIAPRMATTLGKNGIEVDFVVMFDPVERTTVGANVDQIVNYYLPKRKDNKLYPRTDFEGELLNVNVARGGGFNHFNIDKNRGLRDRINARVLELADEADQ